MLQNSYIYHCISFSLFSVPETGSQAATLVMLLCAGPEAWEDS